MKESATVLHTTHRDKNRHWHFLMLLLPSLVFVLVLAFFLKDRYMELQVATQAPVSAVKTRVPVNVKNTTVNAIFANTPSEHQRGLSQVESMAMDEGMMFVFGVKAQPAFWMKDMRFALDFLWIKDGKISQIDRNITPEPLGTPNQELRLYMPNQPVDAVLEVNAGFADTHKIAVGDSVTIP